MTAVVVLSGGVGGAKLVVGLAAQLAASDLTVVVNTGDDFVHWGLNISPDLDTVMYTLAGLVHPGQGWGLVDDTFCALARIEQFGGPSWFRLGDQDLATHLMRTAALARGESLTAITQRLCRALAVGPRVLPMSDGIRRTVFETVDHGVLSFQEYFVKHRFEPTIRRIRFEGSAHPSNAVMTALDAADLIVIAPSNPYVSIDPIITLPGVRDVLARKLVIGVSPIVGGRALKGAAAKQMRELGIRDPSAAAIARHYGGLLTAIVVEHGDGFAGRLQVHQANTIMTTLEDKRRLAGEVLAVAERCRA